MRNGEGLIAGQLNNRLYNLFKEQLTRINSCKQPPRVFISDLYPSFQSWKSVWEAGMVQC